MAETVYFEASWAGIRLWISKITTDEGRTLVVQPYTTGDVPSVQNRGGVPKVARASILFDDMDGEELGPGDRLLRLIEAKDSGLPSVFTHPLLGSYLAEVGEFSHTIEETGTITADITFVATEEVRAVVQPGSGASLAAGTGQVSAAADVCALVLSDVGLESTAPARATAAAETWGGDADSRRVLVDVGALSDQIGQEIEDLNLAADLVLWPALKAFVMLADAVRAAGAAAIGDRGQLMTVRVDSPISLRAIVGGIYPADEGDARRAEALELNDIRTPARIPTGTVLQLVQPRR